MTVFFRHILLLLLGALLPDSERVWRRLHGLTGDVGLVFFPVKLFRCLHGLFLVSIHEQQERKLYDMEARRELG